MPTMRRTTNLRHAGWLTCELVLDVRQGDGFAAEEGGMGAQQLDSRPARRHIATGDAAMCIQVCHMCGWEADPDERLDVCDQCGEPMRAPVIPLPVPEPMSA